MPMIMSKSIFYLRCRQWDNLKVYFRVTTELAKKMCPHKTETAGQTDLSLTKYDNCLEMSIGCVKEINFCNELEIIPLFISNLLKARPEPSIKKWNDIYIDSEQILDKSTGLNIVKEINITKSFIGHFFKQNVQSAEAVATCMFLYLNVSAH